MALVFPILTEFDDRAAKKADQAFTKLGKKFAAVFSVGAVVKFGKESVKAFMEAEREAQQLRAQLEAINLGFAAPFLDEYIDNLELLTGIAGNRLNNAFISLSQATQDVTTAQKLMNVALDVSAATGRDLNTVSIALQRAYKGEVTALARLRIGYTTADLKARDFDEVLTELSDKFRGSSAQAADTLAGKMARLNASVEQSKEAFGAGFVKGIEASDVAIEDLQKTVIDLGDAFGYAAGQAIAFYQNLITDVAEGIEQSDSIFARLVKSLVKNQAEASRVESERNRATLRQRNVILRAEQKTLKIRKDSAKLADAEKKNAEQIAKAKSMFELEQIQIQAALQNKITEEERTRLLLMKAIIEENGGEAERLMEQLKKSQEETAKLAKSLTDLKAGNPFAKWDEYTTYALGLVGQMRAALDDVYRRANDFLRIEKGVGAGIITQPNPNPNAPSNNTAADAAAAAAAAAAKAAADAAARAAADAAAKKAADAIAAAAAAAKAAQDAADAQKKAYEDAEAQAKADADLIAAAAAAAKAAADAIAAAERAAAEAAAAQAAAKTAAEKEAADAQAAAAKGAFDAAKVEEEAAKDLADAAADELGAAAASAAEKIAAEAINAIIESSGVMGRVAGESGLLGAAAITNVIVNVAGSVISQEDLTQAITDSQADYQRSGGGITVYDAKVI